MRKKPTIISKSINEVYQLYLDNKTLDKTATLLNVHIETLRLFFIKHKLPYAKRQKYTQNDSFFSEDTEKSFYWAGFIAADGSIEKTRYRLQITLKRTDKNHLIKFFEDISCNAPIVDREGVDDRPQFKKEMYYSSGCRISSKQIVNDLKKFGITPNKSKTYQIPQEILDHKLSHHFIRGLIDGDGSIYNDPNNIGLCGTPACVKSVFHTLKNNLNLNSGNFDVRDDGLGLMHFQRLDDCQKIIKYLYENASVYLDRKQEKAYSIMLKVERKIKLSKDSLIEARRLYSDATSMGKYLNCSSSTINRRLKEHGLPQVHV